MPIVGLGQLTLTDLNDAIISGTPPANPTNGTLWIDENYSPKLLKKWDGSAWVTIGEVMDEGTGETIEDITETLGNMANDNLLDYNERKVIKDKLTEILGIVIEDISSTLPTVLNLDKDKKGDFYSIRKQATNAGLSSSDALYIAVTTRYNELKTYLEELTPIKPWDLRQANQHLTISVVKSTFRDKWLNYYNAVNALAEATTQKLKENVDDVEVGGRNFLSNGDFSIPLAEGRWKENYFGNVKEIVDISAETPLFQFAYHVKNTTATNGGIFTPLVFEGAVAEAMLGKNVTLTYWLKYQNIVQGTNSFNAGRFGELVIEGAKSDGSKVFSYYRLGVNNTFDSSYVVGTNMTWSKQSATLKIALPSGATKITNISFKHGLEGCTGEFWTTGIKLEIGNKATDWSQDPLDLQGVIYDVQQKILPDSIVSTVTKSKTYVDDMTGKVSTDKIISSINQTAEAIKIQAEKLELTGKLTITDLDENLKNRIDESKLVGILTNESIVLSADKDGNVSSFASATGTFEVYDGETKVTSGVTFSKAVEVGCTVTINSTTGDYAVTSMSADNASVMLTANYKNLVLTKKLTLSKSRQGNTGSTGSPATTYWLVNSVSAIQKSATGVYTPSTITVTGKSQTGTSTPLNYAGRFVISDSTDGTNFTVRYTSASNEASKVYTPLANIKALKVQFYLAGGTTTLLDEQIIPIVSDGAKGDTGDAGKGVVSATVTYQNHTNGTTAPTGTWSSTVPTPIKGQYMWTRTITSYTDGSSVTTYSVAYNATDGQNGSDGKGISSTTVTYQLSTSGTTAPTGSWLASPPTPVKGQYLWTRTVISYTDGTSSTSYSTSYYATDGQNGKDGKDGVNGVSITSVDVEYAQNTSSTTAPTTGWSTTAPTWIDGRYIWSRTVTTYSSGTPTISTPVCITGQKGATGSAGKGITSATVTYQLHTNGTTAPTGTWVSSPPSPVKGQYLWTRTVTSYTDGTSSTTYSVSYLPTDGQNGNDGKGISSTAIAYQISTSGTTAPTGTWVTSPPTPIKGRYLWTRTIVSYTDGSSSTSYSTSYYATDGGKGDTGTGISSITEEYYLSTSKTTQTGGSWTTTPPTWSTGKYMWTRSKIVYTNPASTEYTTPIVDSSWEAVNELQVGGKNLILGSDEEIDTTTYLIKSYTISEDLVGNAEYTFMVKGTVTSSQKFGIWMNGGSNNVGYATTVYKEGVTYVTFKAVAPTAGNERTLNLYNYPSNTTQATVEWVALYKGNMPMDWTPAPEDVEEKINEKATNSDVETLAGIVSGVSASLNAKAGMTEFEALETAFNNRVAQEIEDKEQLASDLATIEGRTTLVETIAGNSKLVTEFINTVISESEEGIYISNGASNTGILISTDRISFLDNNVEVAYISNQTMQINHGIFVESATIANFKFERIPNTEILVIQWVDF
jgi:hypothetical protein